MWYIVAEVERRTPAVDHGGVHRGARSLSLEARLRTRWRAPHVGSPRNKRKSTLHYGNKRRKQEEPS